MDEQERLIQLYEAASLKLLDMIRRSEGLTRRRYLQLFTDVVSMTTSLQENVPSLLLKIVEKSYSQGSEETISNLRVVGFENIDATFSVGIDRAAVQQIVDDAFYTILEATDFMTQDVKQRLETIVQAANSEALIEGQSRRQVTQRAIAEATERGITGIIAKNGARIQVEKYLAGTVQYYQRKAHVDGAINRMVQNNLDLIYVNSVGITCSLCAQYQGRVYSLSGRDDRFPPLILKPPYHAHCVHSAYPWIERYEDREEVSRMLKESNRPFEDNRAEHNIRRYNELQQEKSKKNEARKQWIRYKSRMPDLPELRTFASHKARNTKKYQEWMADYRAFGSIVDE